MRIYIFISLIVLAYTSGCTYKQFNPNPPINNGCDTSTVTYNGKISGIMASACTNCHNTATPAAGIDLSTYAAVAAAASQANFMGSVNHTNNYSQMPKGGPQLPPCERQQLQAWINKGKPQ
jgi:uncharacterized membrane protein